MGNIARGTHLSRMRIHPGSIPLNGGYAHVKVDSASTPGVEYYVSVNTKTGAVERCTCPAFGLYPQTLCKHCRAVIDQRLLQL